MSFARSHNIGGFIDTAGAIDDTTLTAGGAGDNTAITGQVVDRTALGASAKSNGLSGSLSVRWKAVQGNTNTLTLKNVKIQTGAASNGSDMADYQTFADAVVDTGTGTTDRGRAKYDFDLAGAKQYVRAVLTPDLSAANTDTATVSAQFIFGGLDVLP